MKFPVPPAGAEHARFYMEVVGVLRELLVPSGPQLLWACATADMPPAADFKYSMLFNTTLGVPAVSNGTSWLRVDTGAAI